MKPENDAFGKHLLAQYKSWANGEPIDAEIVERDDNFIDFGSISRTYFSEPDEWGGAERKLIDQARGRILDIGCGAGRHSIYLQEKGLDVTGIDNSPGVIEVCRLRGLKKAVLCSIGEIDRFEPDSFDTIVMLGNNFGLFGGPNRAKKILEKIDRITASGAQILVGTLNPYLTEDEAHLKYQERNKKLGRMTGQIRLRIRYGIYLGEWFDYLFVSPREMEAILEDTDWRVKEFIGKEEVRYFAVIEKNPAV